MIFLDIQRDVWRRLNKPSLPDPQTQTRIKSFINQGHRSLLTMPGLDQLRQVTTDFDSVVDEPRVALPQSVARVDAIFDQTNRIRLKEKPLDWLRTVDPQPQTGTPYVYVPIGYQYTATNPDETGLWVVSSSDADVGIIRVVGRRVGGFIAESDVTMTGTTAVQIGTITDWIGIDSVYVSQQAAGTVNVHGDVGLTITHAQIRSGAVRPYYFILHLWPTPSAVLPYTMDYTREIVDMTEDTDEPLLPPDYHDLLAMYARMQEYEKTDDGRFKVAQMDYDKKYKSFQFFLQGRASSRYIPRGMRGSTGINNVGGWYPADFWI